jgi:hypothetical protein
MYCTMLLHTLQPEQLRGRMRALDDDTCFGDVFLEFAPALRMYADYSLQHETTASQMSFIASENDAFR